MKIQKVILKVSIVLFVTFFTLQQAAIAQQSVNIVHSRGETQVAKNPKRVVILDIGSLETYHELGVQVVGGPDHVPAYLEGFKERNPGYTGVGSVARANVAAIAALKPDLIIIGGRLGGVYDSLSTIAPTVLFGIDNTNYWPSFEKNVRTIASLHGKEKLAEDKLAKLSRKRDLVREKTANDESRAFVVMHVRGGHTAYGKHSRFGFPHDVLGLREAQAVDAKTHTGFRLTEEGFVKQVNPDYILLIDRDSAVDPNAVRKPTDELLNDEFKSTNAYKNKKVVNLPGNIWYLAGGGLISVEKQITDIGEQLYGITF